MLSPIDKKNAENVPTVSFPLNDVLQFVQSGKIHFSQKNNSLLSV